MDEERLNRIWNENRVASFKIWPFSDKDSCNINKMAEAGFFWAGSEQEPDSAQCFVCLKTLDGWEAGDDPWREHAVHSPQCPFIVLGQPEHHLTVEQFHQLYLTMVKNLVSKHFSDWKALFDKKFQAIKSEILE